MSAGVSALLLLGHATGYPEQATAPPGVLTLAVALALVQAIGAAMPLGPRAGNRLAAAGAVLTPGAAATAAWYNEQAESPFAWLLLIPAFWVARRGQGRPLLLFLAYMGVLLAALAWRGEPDELWRPAFLFAVIAGICASEYGGATNTVRREAVLEEARARLERAVQDIALARASERQAVAGDIHDFPLQRVIATRMETHRTMRTVEDSTVRQQLTTIGQGLQEAIESMRRIMDGLEPTTLVEVGLAEALREHGRIIAASYGLDVMVEERETLPMPRDSRLVVYRLIAEAMTNTAKHADAQTLEVTLDHDGRSLSAVVRDDGCGMPEAGRFVDHLPASAGTGLALLAQQVAAYHGSFTIDSPAASGTTILFHLPLPDPGGQHHDGTAA
jgi:signal transduction histidine kinase